MTASGKIAKLLERQSCRAVFAESLLLAIAIGVLDYASGYEVSMFVFYGIPIFAVGWCCNRKSALLLATLCAIIWWWADSLTGHFYRHDWIRAWEPTARFGYFGFVAFAGSALRKQQDQLHSRIALLERAQRLEREIIAISEREQRRIGRDLHDGLCQYFAAVGCAVASLQGDLVRVGRNEEAALAGELTELIEQGVIQVRDLARGLIPVQMHEAGLTAAFEQLAGSISRLQNINCTFASDGKALVPSASVAAHLYRVAQEAVHNAIRHGRSQKIEIRLNTMGNAGRLEVLDDGTGIAKSGLPTNGMGLSIMQYRARLIGGNLSITQPNGGGTLISCTFPLTS